MLLLERIDFVAMVGLFVQAFLGWIFVAVLASLRGRDLSRALDNFFLSFVCLAMALTVLSVRFFETHGTSSYGAAWEDGAWRPTLCYAVYQGLKGLFGLLLVRGCYALVEADATPLLRRTLWAAVVLLAASPLVIPDITPLLIVQAPIMIGCAFAALHALAPAPREGLGVRLVRWSLMGLAAAWCIHALSAWGVTRYPPLRYVLAFNSFIDLAVQLTLGTGLIVGIVQAAHQRARSAENQREELQLTIARDERLHALGRLVSGVAHELNNPLTVILAHAQVLAENDPRARILCEQAERCRGIVHSLSALAVQKLTAREDLDVAELFNRVVRGLDPKLLADGRRVQLGEVRARRLTGDRIGLEQVLTNVVVNALHASPPGGVVTLDADRVDGERVALTVTDAGPGVPEDLRRRLFEPFFTTKGPGRGTGLGLAIAHAIVGSHAGTITVDDGPNGVGATLRIVLPRGPAQPPPDPTREAAPLAPEQETERARRLLIVDDDEAVRQVLRMRAERCDWIVSEAASAEDALTGAESLDVHDAVLCDLRMPGIGGIGLHDALERQAPTLLERFVFVTGDLASSQSASFSRRCRRPLVTKPFDFEELFGELNEAARITRADVRGKAASPTARP